MKLTKPRIFLASATLMVAGVGTGVAVAAIPNSSTGVLTACRVTGDAGNVRIIDKQGGASCHSYETEISWPGVSTEFSPELHTDFRDQILTEFGGTNEEVTYNCPTGEKLVFAHAGIRASGQSTSNFPGGKNVTATGTDGDIPVYQYISTSGEITGFKVIHGEPTHAMSVAYSCSE